MVSTGTGIAPFMSMLRTYRGQDRWRRFVVVNGVRRASDLGYRDELEAICRADPTVCYVPVVSREPDATWSGLRGRVQIILDQEVFHPRVGAPLHPDDCHVFLCGNPAMLDELELLLQARGFRTHERHQPGNIHLERYW
jgi:ferredoxin--NADP+ reductase